MIGIFNEHLTLNVDDEHMLNIVERPGGFWVEILEKNFHTIVAITTEMATELAEWINNHQGHPDEQRPPTTGTKKNMKIDNPKGRAWWEWVRTANPWLPPYEKLDPAQIRADMFEVALTVHLEHPSEPFRWDRWENALAREGCTDMTWDTHLATTLRWLSGALENGGASLSYQTHLVRAAIHIRAMAPEGTKWHVPRPSPDGHERERLRSVVRLLLEADQYDSDELRRDRLALAESHLHDLWLSAKEES